MNSQVTVPSTGARTTSLSLWSTPSHFIVRNQNFIDKGLKCLLIEKSQNLLIEEEPGDLTLQQSATKKDEGQIHALLGVLNISGLNYLTVVSEVETVGKLYGVTVYKIKQVKLLPFQVSRSNFRSRKWDSI